LVTSGSVANRIASPISGMVKFEISIYRVKPACFIRHSAPDGLRRRNTRVRPALVEPDWVGKLAGFTLLFEALVLMLAQQMPFAAVARTIGESWHRVHAICRYVDLALAGANLSALSSVAIDGPIGAAKTISRSWPMPTPARSCSSAKAARRQHRRLCPNGL
jgi:Helix-turn-helix domain of transposase family ISL3